MDYEKKFSMALEFIENADISHDDICHQCSEDSEGGSDISDSDIVMLQESLEEEYAEEPNPCKSPSSSNYIMEKGLTSLQERASRVDLFVVISIKLEWHYHLIITRVAIVSVNRIVLVGPPEMNSSPAGECFWESAPP